MDRFFRILNGDRSELICDIEPNNEGPNKMRVKELPPGGTIEACVELIYNMTMDDLRKRTRKGRYVEPRQVGCFFNFINRPISELSVREIGDIYGVDHATVYHSYKQILNLLCGKNEVILKAKIESISRSTGIKYKHLVEECLGKMG